MTNSHGLRYRWWVLRGEMSDPEAPRHHWVTSGIALFVCLPALNSIGLWIEAGKMKRRALEARRFGGGCDAYSSQTLASHHRDSARQNQGGALSEDGQPGACRVGLPRSRP